MRERGWMRRAVGGTATAVALAAVASGAAAGPAGALTPTSTVTFDTAGPHTATIPAGTVAVQAVAIGGRGGGGAGGAGALVQAQFARPTGQRLTVNVGADGGVFAPMLSLPLILPGQGGGGTAVNLCDGALANCTTVLVAGGGGGSGGGTGAPGGSGGAAGAPGGNGSSPAGAAPAVGGAPGTTAGGTGGDGGALPACGGSGSPGSRGADGAAGSGGAGGTAPILAQAGGAGGGGWFGGGGGGAGAACASGTFASGSGAGGGGGSSLVPAGGSLALDTTGAPLVRLTFLRDDTAPTIAIAAPVDGGTYVPGAVVNAAYACADEAGGSGVVSCTGTVADGAPIATARRGSRAFTVTARDAAGNVARATVHYTVRPPPGPAVTRLVATPSSYRFGPHARLHFRFELSAAGSVALKIERRMYAPPYRWKLAGVLRTSKRAGLRGVVFRGRVERRWLLPGVYRLTVVATDAEGRVGNRATRLFRVRSSLAKR